ncbi:S49 family peptidase [Spirochaeta dissipatitropha]
MKHRFILFLSVCLFFGSAAVLSSQEGEQNSNALFRFESAASPDIMFAAGLNPAALGFSNTSGFFSEISYPLNEHNKSIRYNPLLAQSNTYLSLVLPGIGLSYESYNLQGTEDESYLTVGAGARFARWLSLGYAARYRIGNLTEAEFIAGLLMRPHASLSLAAAYKADSNDTWSVQPAAAFRPLALLPLSEGTAERLTISADAMYNAQGAIGDFFGFQQTAVTLEIVPGMFVYGNYHADQSWSAGMDFSIGFGRSGFRAVSDSSEISISSRSSLEFPAYRTLPSPADSRIIEYQGTLSFVETESFQNIGSFTMSDGRRPYRDFIAEIETYSDDPSVTALMFRNVQFQGDLAIATEIAAALSAFRSRGKDVLFSLEGADSLTYYIAAASGAQIYMRPGSMILVQGFGSSQLFFGNLLAGMGIDVIGFETHPAKSANHSLTESAYSEEARENIEAYLSDAYAQYLEAIAEGRREQLTEEISVIWDDAPFLVIADALNYGLIDGILYEDQVQELINDLYPGAEKARPDRTVTRDASWYRPRNPRIAVITATGPIFTGSGLTGTSIGSDTLAAQIRQAREDDNTEAILLRVSSGGGSALASDIIAREVYLTVHGPDSKPLVVSMGSVAASGGYYIAAYADYIFAYPTTLTGSIGVTSLSIHVDRLLEEWNITSERIETSSSSGFLDPFFPLREDDARAYSRSMDAIYEQFLTVASEGRKMDRDELDIHARGQVWTGTQALDRGLIDELGGFYDALLKTRELAGIEGDFEIYSPSSSSWQELSGMTAGLARLVISEPTIPGLDGLLNEYKLLKQLSEEGILYWTPLSGFID